MNLLIMGAPGAGKGSVSNRIIEKYDVVHISTGDMLRAAMASQSPLGKKVSEYMETGNLVPDSIIHDIIVERLACDDIKKGFLFDGYPRTLAQAVDLEEIMVKLGLKLDKVINLEISDDTLTKRITGRRNCPKCGEIYNIYYSPSEVEGICDKCGETLTIRKDDNVDSLKIRLNEYHKNAKPIVEYYEEKGLVHQVNADQDRDAVFTDVAAGLEVFR